MDPSDRAARRYRSSGLSVHQVRQALGPLYRIPTGFSAMTSHPLILDIVAHFTLAVVKVTLNVKVLEILICCTDSVESSDKAAWRCKSSGLIEH